LCLVSFNFKGYNIWGWLLTNIYYVLYKSTPPLFLSRTEGSHFYFVKEPTKDNHHHSDDRKAKATRLVKFNLKYKIMCFKFQQLFN